MAELESVKQSLDSWREVAVILYSVITWEQDWYPGLTAGIVTVMFLTVHWLGPSIITLVSVIGMVITLLDYLVPMISDMVIPRSSWDEAKNKRLETVAKFIINCSQLVSSVCSKYRGARTSAPVYHAAITTVTLLVTAFIGSLVSGAVLAYLVLMVTLMLPGLHSRGLLADYCGSVVGYVEEMVKGKKRE